jgi:hypothetical protein
LEKLSYEAVDAVWSDYESDTTDHIPELIKTFEKRQPNILGYLIATGSDVISQKEKEVLLFLGLMIWRVVDHYYPSLPQVPAELIEEKEEQNLKMLEYLAGESETGFRETVDIIMRSYGQEELLRYIIERIYEEPQKGSHIRQKTIGAIVIFAKSVIDVLDNVDPKQ